MKSAQGVLTVAIRPKRPSKRNLATRSDRPTSQLSGLRARNATSSITTALKVDESDICDGSIALNLTDDAAWDWVVVGVGERLVTLFWKIKILLETSKITL